LKEEVITAGFGGQGILFAGQVLAYSAMLEGKEATWLPSYGPEMRGGTANCMVVISGGPIRSPLVYQPTTALVFNLPSMDRFEGSVIPGGLLLVNTGLVPRPPSRRDLRVLGVPAEGIAREVAGRQVVNMVMLGAAIVAGSLVSLESALAALEDVTPPHRRDNLEPNRQAILRGAQVARGGVSL
jgi:2-oxoglutarate ferredoxin oxidoreductase subunit gamma